MNQAARTAREAEMHLENYEFRSELMRNLQARAIREGLELAREEGRAAVARALVRVLVGRGFELEPRHHAMIAACTELAQLDAWLVRALGATSLDAVFSD